MDIERIQKQVADLKTYVSLLQNASASEFNDDLVSTLHRISDVLDDLQPRLVDPADLSKEAEQKVLDTIVGLTASIDGLEGREWTEDFIDETVENAIRNTDFEADIDVYVK